MSNGKEPAVPTPNHLRYELGSRKVRFYSLTKSNIENLARDIEDSKALSVRASASLTALITLIVECIVNEFAKMPPAGQAVMYIGIPLFGILTLVYGIQWFKNKKPISELINCRLEEWEEENLEE